MTEAEWLACEDPEQMLETVGDEIDERKLRLFACACCRAVWNEKWPHWSRRVVETAERYVDGLVTEKELNEVRSLACQSAQRAVEYESRQRRPIPNPPITTRLFFAADTAQRGQPFVVNRYRVFRYDEQLRQLALPLLCSVVGNPFRPVTFAPEWRTVTAVALANLMYDAHDFSAMPILADALQDAGCDNDDILNHCRGDGPHVRGCWVVDLVLGKE